MRRTPSLFLLVLLAASSPAAAQSASTFTPGTRLRVSGPSLQEATVTRLVRLSSDTLVLLAIATADTLRIPLSDVARLEVSSGRRGNGGIGAGAGLVIGAAAGAAIGRASASPTDCAPDILCSGVDRGIGTVGGAMLGGLGGLLLGALVGSAITSERWREITLPTGQRRTAIEPAIRGAGIGVQLRF